MRHDKKEMGNIEKCGVSIFTSRMWSQAGPWGKQKWRFRLQDIFLQSLATRVTNSFPIWFQDAHKYTHTCSRHPLKGAISVAAYFLQVSFALLVCGF